MESYVYSYLFFALKVLLLALKVSETGAECPSLWVRNGTSCYMFAQTKSNWFHAAHQCRSLESNLVTIETADENSFLRQKLKDLHTKDDPQTIGYWTGANDLETEGEWVWNYPDGRLLNYTDWFPGEPNDHWYDGRQEDCMALWGHDSHDYHWNDQPCDITDYFICEMIADGALIG